jgi:Zn-dependent metalloprotease
MKPGKKKKVKKVMGEFKRKKLKSSSGKKVTNRKQAIAIALSEARRKKRRS